MIPDADYVYEALLCYNYLPMVKQHRDDVPPLFTTEHFTPAIADELIDTQDNRGSKGDDPRGRDGYDQIEYRTTRFNNILRVMHIPHPNPYARLCKCIHKNWAKLEYTAQNTISQVRPSVHGGGRLVVMEDYDEREMGRVIVMEKEQFPHDIDQHLSLSFGAQYYVDADVAACFPSLYTHAIPWALVGHDSAKKSRGRNEWYNQLDSSQRFLKRGETHGVPVGPATSNLVNEVILAKVDKALQPKYRFLRYIDDYKCYCRSREEADAFLRDLGAELAKYLHSVNAKKVSVSTLPLPSRSGWINDISGRIPPEGDITARQVVSFFDYASQLQQQQPHGSVVKYAARVLARRVDGDAAAMFVNYAMQLAYHYPIVLPLICDVLERVGASIQVDRIHILVQRHLAYRRSDAACWALYLLHLCGEALDARVADEIVASRDCMAMATMVAVGQHVGLVREFVKTLDPSNPYEVDQYWMLVYELTNRDELAQTALGGYFKTTGLDVLGKHKVKFLVMPTPRRDESSEPDSDNRFDAHDQF